MARRTGLWTARVIVGVATVISALLLMTGFWFSSLYMMAVVGASGWLAALVVALGIGFAGSSHLSGLQVLGVANAAVIVGFGCFLATWNAPAVAIAVTFVVLAGSLPVAAGAVLVGWFARFVGRRTRGVPAA